MYAKKNGIKSSENLAFYKFVPLPPVIKPVSGVYDNKIDVMIFEDPLSPIGANHVIYYNKNSDGKADTLYLNGKITVDRDEIIKAYTIKDYDPLDKTSGTYSKPVYEYYLFSGGSMPGSGKVYVNSPFDVRAHLCRKRAFGNAVQPRHNHKHGLGLQHPLQIYRNTHER